MRIFYRRPLTLLALLTALFAAADVTAQCTDPCLMRDGLENEYSVAASDAEAARFLNQATFGATATDIAAVRSQGIGGWLSQQFALQPTLARPFLESVARVRHDENRTLSQDDRVHRWYDTAVKAPDQLRQKMAYALGQIIVASDRNDSLSGEVLQMAEWNDLLVRNAFGNYRQLLQEASFSPVMGRYLTHLRNRRYELNPTFTTQTGPPATYTITAYAADNNGSEPDENYAREIMQLFSVGLLSRNPDFSLIDIDPGTPGVQTQSTYDQQMIRTLARVFTGLAFDCNPTTTVQGITVRQNCTGTRNTDAPPTPACTGTECRFYNRTNLFGQSPPRARLPNNSGDSSLIHPDWYRPMVCYPHYNDNGRDVDRFQLSGQGPTNPVATTINPGVTIPAGAPERTKSLILSDTLLATQDELQPGVSKETVLNCSPSTGQNILTASQRAECIAYCEDNIHAAIDLMFYHPNLPPMVARQLILRFVSSNPSPQYIERVAQRFINDGNGVRGNLASTLDAVLTDSEARQPFAGQFGKPREPMLRLISIWRHFGAISGGNTCRNNGSSSVGNGNIACWGSASPQNTYLQRPLGANSVFNFYEPDYQPPGAIADAGLFAPEFQIINENTTMLAANDLFRRICESYGSDNCNGAFVATPSTDIAHIPPANLDALPGMACGSDVVNGCSGVEDMNLIEALNLRMLGGLMSGQVATPALCSDPGNFGMKSVLHNLLKCGLIGNLGQTGGTAGRDARRRKALYLIHLISISPEFAHQR
jgi:uncharacterized protein (DUF1800 family)